MDVCGGECVDAEEQRNEEISAGLEDDAAAEAPAKELQPTLCDALPEHIKVKKLKTKYFHSFTNLFSL